MDTLRARTHSTQAGFSLVELLVAVVITLMVTGAIYGLLASSQTAFRREPELAERQQNIRLAMDLIERDVAAAGQGLPYFAQAFTIADAAGGPCVAGLDGCGPGAILGTISGAPIDVLQMLSTEEQCPLATVCNAPAVGAPGAITTNEAIPACMGALGQSRLVAITDRVFWRIQPATTVAALVCPAGGAAPNGTVNATLAGLPLVGSPAGLPVVPAPPLPPAPAGPAWLGAARITRYEVGVDPSDGAPALYRSVTGYFDDAGAVVGGAPQVAGAAPAGNWQLVARGFEDLQVEYMDGGGAWADSPTPVTCAAAIAGSTTPPPMGGICTLGEVNTLVRQVRVTLSSRSMAAGLQGQTLAPGGAPAAVRGQLQGVTVPRATLIALQIQNRYMR